jgi:SagB-type dehydrogenase family enzyme
MTDLFAIDRGMDLGTEALGSEIIPALDALLTQLSASQQATLHSMLTRSLARMGLRAEDGFRPELDEISLMHGAMKAEALAVSYEELEAVQSPPTLKRYPDARCFALPTDLLPLDHSLERVIRARASRRDFEGGTLRLDQLGTLLMYTCGTKKTIRAYNRRDFPVRYTPSAGGLQSVELYLVANSVAGLPQGMYHYAPDVHGLELINTGNMRRKMVLFCFQQEWIGVASAVLLITCVRERVEWKYGPRSYRFMHLDAGFLGQSIYLVTSALGLRTCAVAGFSEDALNDLVGVDGRYEFVVLAFPVGLKPTTGAAPGAAKPVTLAGGPDGAPAACLPTPHPD